MHGFHNENRSRVSGFSRGDKDVAGQSTESACGRGADVCGGAGVDGSLKRDLPLFLIDHKKPDRHKYDFQVGPRSLQNNRNETMSCSILLAG